MPAPYDDQQAAALAGLAACVRDIPRDLECGVGIYRAADGKYYYTDPQSGKNGSIDGMSLRIPKQSALTAFAHTHPAEPRVGADDTSDAFSPADVKFGKRLGVDMYLGSEKSGRVTQLTKKSRTGARGVVYGTDVGDLAKPQTDLETQALITALRSHGT